MAHTNDDAPTCPKCDGPMEEGDDCTSLECNPVASPELLETVRAIEANAGRRPADDIAFVDPMDAWTRRNARGAK